MNRKKSILALLACIVLFAAALVLAILFQGPSDENFHSGSPIVISEVLASNRTYPAPNGEFLDYIELRNVSDSPVDISGYMLGDQPDFVGYTFRNGTVLPAGGYIVCWCDKENETGTYAKFGISKKGEETIFLYNSSNVLVDSVELPMINDNVPYIRLEDNSWTTGSHATPGFANTEDGYAEWIQSTDYVAPQIQISEVMPGGGFTLHDGMLTESDWVELYNGGSKPVTLEGVFLSDDPMDRTKWVIPTMTVEPNTYVVIRCAGSTATAQDANFSLGREGGTVILTGKYGDTIAMTEYPAVGKSGSWALQDDGSYAQSHKTTPGFPNTDEGYTAWLKAAGQDEIPVVISEVMTANRSTLLDQAGQLCDWVELYNPSDETVSLAGLHLSNDPTDLMKWVLPDIRMTAGQRIVIPCSGSLASEGEADFSLPQEGCTMVLSGIIGNVVSETQVPWVKEDCTWALQEDGTYAESGNPSPGFPNTDEGATAFRETQVLTSPLIISEVMPSNASYLIQSDGKCYDWVELQNISTESVRLADYALSNSTKDLQKFVLPDVTLAPGERYIIVCSGNVELTGRYPHAPFTVGREQDWVYLSHASKGGILDMIRIYDVPYQHSVGRVDGKNGTYYFTNPTPGTSNGTGVEFISENPTVLTADGVYNNVTSLSVEISGKGELYYTTDGSYPTRYSNPYTGPIRLTSTTALRVVSLEEGKLPSDIITAVYIINENHTLPVVSIVAPPHTLFDGGIYTNYTQDREVRANLKLFELDGNSFTIDCGLKMHGHTGLEAPKKSFKVNFRGRYGEKYLKYPVYGETGPEVYDSLIIRSGQDYPTSIFRDELFTSLARDMGGDVLAQRDKYSILYVNGEYFGIYCIKEAWTELMYAQNKGGSPDNVEIVQAPVGADSEIFELFMFCLNNDLSKSKNYEYVESKVDIDSLIDWMIIEAYSTNGDVQQNLRYVRSADTGWKWQFCLYDLDWAFYYHNTFTHVLSPHQTWQHLYLTRRIIKNPVFREKFLARCSELMGTVLSNENVTARINYYETLLTPEVPRDREKWGGSLQAWQNKVQYLRDFVNIGYQGKDNLKFMVDSLVKYIDLTDAEKNKYFSRWA